MKLLSIQFSAASSSSLTHTYYRISLMCLNSQFLSITTVRLVYSDGVGGSVSRVVALFILHEFSYISAETKEQKENM
jgi:hypothetical protein